MKKKKVPLDVFEESVLPSLQLKHKDIGALQKSIDDDYLIVDTDGEGKEITVKFTVSKPAKPAGEAEGDEEPDLKKMVADAVGEALKAHTPAGARNPLGGAGGAGSKDKDGKMIIPATVKRVSVLRNFKRAEVNGYTAEQRAYRFGMWGLACMGNENAKRFCDEQGIPLVVDQKAAHAEGTNTLGGYLVPEEFGQDMIDLRLEYGVARRILRRVTMTSDTRTDPRRVSGLTATFVGENAAGSESNKTWDNVRLTAKDLMVLSRMSNQLSADAVISIGDDLAGEISYAFTLKEDQCAFIGDGSPTYGGITGFLPKLITINGVDDGGGLVLASGNLFSEFVLGDFNRMLGRVPQYARKRGMQWVASSTFYYGTMQKVELASGGVVSMEVRQGNLAQRPLFLGVPVEFSEVYPAADVNSQIACTLGAHDLAASFGDRQQDSIAFSDSATIGGESVFERNQIAIRGTERFDVNVHDLGTATTAGPVVGLISASA